MKETFINHNFREDSLRLIDICESIIDDFNEQGYTLTLRQLYYQLVAKDLIENNEKSYKTIGSLITKAREAGLISWSDIEDRNRSCRQYSKEEDLNTVLQNLEYKIRYNYWIRQKYYVEVWVEKDALAGVISKPCERLDVPYMACKGYLSASEAYRAGKRFEEKAAEGKQTVLIHLGDHDPSGIDMTRDNQARLELFSGGTEIQVKRIALNIDQVHKYNPPPNPAKITDPRAKDYIKTYGNISWELDALTPSVIDNLITKEIKKYIDAEIWNETISEEKAVRDRIKVIPRFHKKIFKMVDDHLKK